MISFVTKECKYCNKEFKVSSKNKRALKRLYCSRSCQSKGISRTDIRKNTICLVCDKEFKHYGERVLCSRECSAKYMSMERLGINNPAYRGNLKFVEVQCLYCNEPFKYTMAGRHKERLPKFCSRECFALSQLGINKETGEPAKYNKQYPYEFKVLRETIKARDHFTCCLCGASESLHVHHIDYDKNNNDKDNLITLCQTCHMLTNFNRSFWEIIFSAVLSGSKLVRKGWGFEVHITNNNSYCLKYLVFFKDRKFSFHYHPLKKELWHCLLGEFDCILQKEDGEKNLVKFRKGDKIEVESGIKHQLTALKNSILIEVSTEHFDEDSHRIIKGD
jgi:mannose-6-phosphate isomerase-like protein (cupin superfamily)